jgi:hypothetical protein
VINQSTLHVSDLFMLLFCVIYLNEFYFLVYSIMFFFFLLCNLVAEHGGAGVVFSQPSDGIIGSKVD